MICQNCGTQNVDHSLFCVKCGLPIQNSNIPNQNPSMNAQVEPSMPTPTQQNLNHMNQFSQQTNQTISESIKGATSEPTPPSIVQTNLEPMTPKTNHTPVQNTKMNFKEYFTIIISVLLKPFTALNDKINHFNTFQNSAILSVIVSLVAMLVTLIKTMIEAVRVTTGGLFSEPKTEWVFENLKEIEYIKVIGLNLLIFLAIIFAIACVYYVVGLIIKKQTNFARLLGISAVSVVPMLLCSLLLSPFLSMIYGPLGMGATIVGAVYTLIIIYETMNAEIQLEGNIKYYFNLVCLSILFIAGYYAYMKFLMASIGDLSSILDMFG